MAPINPTSTPAVRSRRPWPWIIAGTLLLAVVAAAGGWHLRGKYHHDRELQIAQALAEGRLDQASESVERWLMSSPDSASAHYFKARVAWEQNDLSTVDEELVRARILGYDWTPLARLRGLLLARANQASEAEPLLRDAFYDARELDGEVAEALARLYLRTFRLTEAAAVLDRWSRELPGDARPYLLLTEIDLRTEVASDIIITRYRAALERDPTLDQARLRLAEELRKNHQTAEAASEYALYLTRKPEDPVGYLGAGQNAVEMGDFAEAAHLLDQSLRLAPNDPIALAARGALERRRGNLEPALQYFDQAVKSDPFDHNNRYQRMLILASLGRKVAAESERQIVEQLKDDQERFDEIGRRLVRKPLDPELRGEAAIWLMKHGREDEAVEWANLVLRADPSHPAMNHLLADYYRKRGQVGLSNLHDASAAQHAPYVESPP
jgi:tetratricopeptide (TPR) repeat protein